jgi:hypothetical protein
LDIFDLTFQRCPTVVASVRLQGVYPERLGFLFVGAANGGCVLFDELRRVG